MPPDVKISFGLIIDVGLYLGVFFFSRNVCEKSISLLVMLCFFGLCPISFFCLKDKILVLYARLFVCTWFQGPISAVLPLLLLTPSQKKRRGRDAEMELFVVMPLKNDFAQYAWRVISKILCARTLVS